MFQILLTYTGQRQPTLHIQSDVSVVGITDSVPHGTRKNSRKVPVRSIDVKITFCFSL